MKNTGVFLRITLLVACGLFALEAHSKIEESNTLYYYDEPATLSFDDMIDSVNAGTDYQDFNSAKRPLGNGHHWVVLMLSAQKDSPQQQWILEIDFPNLDRVEALVLYDNGVRNHYFSGDEVAFKKWPIKYRKPSFPLDHLNGHNAKIFLQIESESPLVMPLYLLTKTEQENVQRSELFLFGAFYGAIFILALYNAGVYFSLRDKSYQFYILYILSFLLVQAGTTGLGQQYIWPLYDGATTRIALLASIFTNYFMVHFVIHFLDLKNHRPDLETYLRWIARIVVLLTPTLLFEHYAYSQLGIHGLNFISMAAITVVTLLVLRSNRRPAIYLLISYSVLFSSILLALLFQDNLIAHYPFMDYSTSLAILIEAIVLSVGLSEKIAKLRLENESAEKKRLIIQEGLTQQLIQTREHERAEISKILHDGINHNLVVVRKDIGRLLRSNETYNSEYSKSLNTIDEMLGKTINEIREISHLSHPQIVRHLGLEAALKTLLENSLDSSITWNMYLDEVILNYDTQLFLYRAVQESITNMIKHANASECLVRLQLDRRNKKIVFIIKDDGDGFDAASVHWSFGLRTLNEHCKSVSGVFTVESSQREGTTLSITLPSAQ